MVLTGGTVFTKTESTVHWPHVDILEKESETMLLVMVDFSIIFVNVEYNS